MRDDQSCMVGYRFVPYDVAYFDLDLLTHGDDIVDAACPSCFNCMGWNALIEDEADTWEGETMEDILGVYVPVRVVILQCANCLHEIKPCAIMFKNETTGEAEEILKDV